MLYNPLHLTKIDELQKSNQISDEFIDRYQFIGQIVQFLAMV